MKGQKGQLATLPAVIVTLIVVGALLATGFWVSETLMDNERFYSSYSATNETGWINDTEYRLTSWTGEGTKNFVVTYATNSTDGTTIDSANYTVDAIFGTVVGSAARSANWSAANFSYSYDSGGQGWTGIYSVITALRTVPTLLGLIILIAIIGIVLAVVFNVIPGTRVAGA